MSLHTARFVFYALVLKTIFIPESAHAQVTVAGNSNSTEQIMCNLILIMTGTTGKAVATIGIIGMGAGALFGKITWNAAMLSVLSIGLVFGAAGIVGDLGGGPGFALILGYAPSAGDGSGTGLSPGLDPGLATDPAGSSAAGASASTCTAASVSAN